MARSPEAGATPGAARPARPRVLIVHSYMDVLGGAERLSLNVIRHLLEHTGADVTLFTLAPPDPAAVRRECGFDFAPVHVARPRLPRRRLPFLLATALLHRAARRRAAAYDLCIGTFNELWLGRPAVQKVHHPLFADRRLLARYHIVEPGTPSRFQRLYDAVARRLAGITPERLAQNLTLTNSRFMAGVIEEAYGIAGSEPLYPAYLPARPAPYPDEAARPPLFASVGRIAPDKHTLPLVAMFEAVHRRVPAARFVIAGYAGDPAYLAAVRARVAAASCPIELRVDLDRGGVEALYREAGYFVNPKPFEHLGLTAIEAVAGGCLPLVHDSGGSSDVVPCPELRYTSPEDLAERAARLVADEGLRRRLRGELEAHGELFTRDRFDAQVADIVRRGLALRGAPPLSERAGPA